MRYQAKAFPWLFHDKQDGSSLTTRTRIFSPCKPKWVSCSLLDASIWRRAQFIGRITVSEAKGARLKMVGHVKNGCDRNPIIAPPISADIS